MRGGARAARGVLKQINASKEVGNGYNDEGAGAAAAAAPRRIMSSSAWGDDLRALVMRRAERAVATRVAQLLADGII